ncbi:MAG TPA: universal stress protein [Solirubrobacterales bacterium]|nr:universal stress protein [Solirubrobacterales bacterium]
MSGIVVGYDGSNSAKAALEQAIGLAKELADSVVIVFGYAARGYEGGAMTAQRDAIKEHAEKVTAEATETARAAGVDSEVVLVPEKGAEALSDLAAQRKARMIVVGTHGESTLRGAMLGSTAHTLVHIAETPVLIVRL